MTTLYNVYASPSGEFLMTAPMQVISNVFRLHHDATRRVLQELEQTQITKVHFNGHPAIMNLIAITITNNIGSKGYRLGAR